MVIPRRKLRVGRLETAGEGEAKLLAARVTRSIRLAGS